MFNKKIIISLIIILRIIGIGFFLVYNQNINSFERAKREILLTKKIRVSKILEEVGESTLHRIIDNEEDVQEIIGI